MQDLQNKTTVLIVSLFLLIPLLIPQLFAAESTPLEQGISYYKQENYDEALPLLQKARKEDPSSSLAAYYLGITYKKLQNYKEAKMHLIDAVSLTPKIKEALLELIETLYQLGETKEAQKYIAIAETEKIKEAQTAFLKGLILLKEGKNLEAVEAFKSAKQFDGSVSQAADYQIGLAYLKEKRFKEAKSVFKDVMVLDPNSNLADFSDEYVKAIKRKEEAEKPYRITAGAYGEYDTNVLLKPSDTTVAANITGEADWREVYTGLGEYRLKMTDRFSVTPQFSFYRAHENNIGILNVTSYTVTVTPNYNIDKGTIGLPVGYNYTDVGESKYLTTLSATPTLNYLLGKTNMAQATFKYQKNDFTRPAIIPDENRTSNFFAGGLGWYHFFAENKGFFGAHYELDKDDTKGSNWRFLGNRFDATVLYPFWEKFRASLAGEIFLQDFDKTNSVFGKERDDQVYTVSSMLAYNFWKAAELQFRYTFVKDRSNIKVYDYNRNIFGLGLEYKF